MVHHAHVHLTCRWFSHNTHINQKAKKLREWNMLPDRLCSRVKLTFNYSIAIERFANNSKSTMALINFPFDDITCPTLTHRHRILWSCVLWCERWTCNSHKIESKKCMLELHTTPMSGMSTKCMTQLRPEQNGGRKKQSKGAASCVVIVVFNQQLYWRYEGRRRRSWALYSSSFFSSRTNSSDREIYFILDCVLRGEQQQRCMEKMIALNGESKRESEKTMMMAVTVAERME